MCEPQRVRRVRVGAYARIHRDQKILLVKMGMGPFKGAWSLPGGGLDFAEPPLEGMIREVREETGMLLVKEQCCLFDVVSYKTTWHDPHKEPEDLHFVGVVFDVVLSETNIAELHFDGDGGSSETAQWLGREELSQVRLSPIFERLIQGT